MNQIFKKSEIIEVIKNAIQVSINENEGKKVSLNFSQGSRIGSILDKVSDNLFTYLKKKDIKLE